MNKITIQQSILSNGANIICDTCKLLTGRAWTIGGANTLQICHKCLRQLAVDIVKKL